jgi:hypothetical protein
MIIKKIFFHFIRKYLLQILKIFLQSYITKQKLNTNKITLKNKNEKHLKFNY